MKKLFVMLFCLVAAFVSAEEIHYTIPQGFLDGTADIRNKIFWWPFDSQESMQGVEAQFNNLYIQEVIQRGDFSRMPVHLHPIARDILDRGRPTFGPVSNFYILLITDDRYGVLWAFWNDTTPAVIMGVGPGVKELRRYFFELEPR